MTKMFKHTVYTFDLELRYASPFFANEQYGNNFCDRVPLAIPEIKELKLLRQPNGMHNFEYILRCDYYGTDIADGTEIWKRLFLFYQDYVGDPAMFIETHGRQWHSQEVFDPEDYQKYREQQNKKVFVRKLTAR